MRKTPQEMRGFPFLTIQLRGTAAGRQVDGARVALQHNIGLGGAAVVSVYKPAVKTPVAA